jgi:hypothetical protein
MVGEVDGGEAAIEIFERYERWHVLAIPVALISLIDLYGSANRV